ncbi:MAG TPA: sn-glycerol-1-phosphate dehydrogenase [Acholeplasmataceae bacterium]|jgi:glycerol-1-phosphate dehydrogenase [NAD(P)+]|nr:sn-glycerol-1-phosphate dehydrogenase [Acholeplasmataceae bacterium]
MISSKLVNIEYKNEELFPDFRNIIQGKHLIMICDENTEVYADQYASYFREAANKIEKFVFLRDFIPDEDAIKTTENVSKQADYILAVGSGTINDLCKYIAKILHLPMGVIPTAPSMDGYLSTGSALIIGNMKVTKEVAMPKNILIDLDVLFTSPRDMIIAGYGDIIGKITSLADWKLANICKGEQINTEAYRMMSAALNDTIINLRGDDPFSKESIECLIDALNTAGIAMAIAGNSRPASGSEHHLSHYLEIYFLKNNMPTVLHGIKVALGCLLSIELYKNLLKHVNNGDIIELINSLPDYGTIYELLNKINAPLKFQDINVNKDLFREVVFNAHTMRDRFTILSYYHKYNLLDQIMDDLLAKFF